MKRFALVLATLLVTSSAHAQEEPAPVPARPDRVFFSLDGGYAYQNLYSTGINAIDFSAVFGGQLSTAFAMAAIAELDRGWTEYGLTTTTLNLGPLFEGHVGRFRFGGGPRLGMLIIDRVTDSNSLSSTSAGLFVRASLDLVTFNEGRGAFFLVGKANTDNVGAGLYGASGGLGVRF